jgi:hypothetical protein
MKLEKWGLEKKYSGAFNATTVDSCLVFLKLQQMPTVN